MVKVSDNLLSLHREEEELRARSLALIEASADMSLNISMVEACMDMLQFVRTNSPEMSEDQVIVALISASIFNSMASALRLLFGGYYQSSGLQIRYIMESGWLLDYLQTEPHLVHQWKNTPEKERYKVFRPSKIRRALDKRDGFVEKKRDAHYDRLCTLCGHPTFAGFTMLRPEPSAEAFMGPFLVPNLLQMCVQELVMVSITACAAFMRYFPPRTPLDHKARLGYLEKQNEWACYVYGTDHLKSDDLGKIKELIASLENTGKV